MSYKIYFFFVKNRIVLSIIILYFINIFLVKNVDKNLIKNDKIFRLLISRFLEKFSLFISLDLT